MSRVMWLLTLVFTVMMSVGGLALFFSNNYAQKKWNPDGE
ncbi:hypothetical protein CDEF62S_03628 [Castellaniella defragrans]